MCAAPRRARDAAIIDLTGGRKRGGGGDAAKLGKEDRARRGAHSRRRRAGRTLRTDGADSRDMPTRTVAGRLPRSYNTRTTHTHTHTHYTIVTMSAGATTHRALPPHSAWSGRQQACMNMRGPSQQSDVENASARARRERARRRGTVARAAGPRRQQAQPDARKG